MVRMEGDREEEEEEVRVEQVHTCGEVNGGTVHILPRLLLLPSSWLLSVIVTFFYLPLLRYSLGLPSHPPLAFPSTLPSFTPFTSFLSPPPISNAQFPLSRPQKSAYPPPPSFRPTLPSVFSPLYFHSTLHLISPHAHKPVLIRSRTGPAPLLISATILQTPRTVSLE